MLFQKFVPNAMTVRVHHPNLGHLVNALLRPGHWTAAHSSRINMAHVTFCTATYKHFRVRAPSLDTIPLPHKVAVCVLDSPASGVRFGTFVPFFQYAANRLPIRTQYGTPKFVGKIPPGAHSAGDVLGDVIFIEDKYAFRHVFGQLTDPAGTIPGNKDDFYRI